MTHDRLLAIALRAELDADKLAKLATMRALLADRLQARNDPRADKATRSAAFTARAATIAADDARKARAAIAEAAAWYKE
jgi:hypothetical protein